TYGRATNYRNLTHPSLPNYLAMAGGSTFGVHDDNNPASHKLTGASVFDVAISRNQTAKTYAESMGATPCRLTPANPYAVKHNPWAYFSQHRANCGKYDVNAGAPTSGALHQDIVTGKLPRVGMLIPNLCNDAHDCSLSSADNWLHKWVGVIQSGVDWKAGRLAVVVTFDEVEGSGTGSLLTVLLSPRLHGKVVSTRLDHYSWCRWMTDLVGGPALRSAASAPSLGKAFSLT
ncbi:MAG: putative hydrolase, partial [Frankiales bacterium]|nr:putative hydrolase [Frankiales bacterium]